MQRITVCLVFCFVLLVSTSEAQQQYRYDIIATSSASRQIFAAPSINNNGDVAFAGRNNPGGGGVFTDYLPNSPMDLLTGFSSQSAWTSSPQLQINDSRKIIAWWSNFTTSPIQNYLFLVDGRGPNLPTELIAAANGTGGFNDFDEIWPTGITFANGTLPVFQTRTGNDTSILTSGTRPNFTSRNLSPSFGSSMRPMVSDNDTAVVRLGADGNAPIATLEKLALTSIVYPPITIATTAEGFSQFGQSPSISKNDEAIAFYADLNQAGATALGTNPGPGVFVSIRLASTRKIVRITGRLVEDNSAQGGNDNDICDPGETCVQGELGTTTTGNRIFFNSFDQNARIDVGYIASGKAGIQDDLVMVSFVGTPNIASDIPGGTFSNQTGLWTQVATITDNTGYVRSPDKAVPVAQVGTTINGNTITQISVYDQIANNIDRVAFWAGSTTGNMIIRAVRDPGTPVIFVAGVGGSTLLKDNSGANGDKLWLPPSATSSLLDLNISNPVRIPDALRKDTISVPILQDSEIVTYKPLLDYLKDSGYVEYNVDDNENNRSATCGGQATDPTRLAALQAKHPTLFVFPYDWRKSNGNTGSNTNVTKLREYIECIRAIYPNSQVNVVAHSMGGLLTRRYILDNPGNHHIKTMITVGSPWLGAPRAIHALETGSFMGGAFDTGPARIKDVLFASEIKQLIENFPGAHELIPSQKYFELGGNPLRVNGSNYDFNQTVGWLNALHPGSNPGTNAQNFHTQSQDDWTGDTTQVNYYHIYGRQLHNRTVGRIEPRLTAHVAGSGSISAIYKQAFPIATSGDGTVPIISSSRRVDAGSGLTAGCGSSNDSRCIGVCYVTENPDDPDEENSEHGGMTRNPQVLSQIRQILNFTDGFISSNPSFEGSNSCHLPPNNFAPQTQTESHYLTMSGILDVRITDSQGRNNDSLGTAYKKRVPGVREQVIGEQSVQITTPISNTYTIRFTGNGQSTAIEDIRGSTNELADASLIVRYDDLIIENGKIAELKIVNDQIDSLKYDADGDGTPETVIPPSRIITDPQTEDLQPPTASINWGLYQSTRRVTVTASDSGSGVKRIYVRLPYATNFQYVDGGLASFKVIKQGTLGWRFDLVTEDNAGNRTGVVTYSLQ